MFTDLIYSVVLYSQFEIDEFGNIRNKRTGTIYKRTIGKNGYYIVTLPMGKRGVVKSVRVHKALAESFIPNPHQYKVVNHKDENKLNISLDNLEWVTSQMNTQLSLKTRYQKNAFANNRKLTAEDVAYIRDDHIHSYQALARKFNVSKTTIGNVKHNYLYK